jgi:hypothetical protein
MNYFVATDPRITFIGYFSGSLWFAQLDERRIIHSLYRVEPDR